MGLTNDMLALFKKIHREIFFSLLMTNFHNDLICTTMEEVDQTIKKVIYLLEQKKSYDEEEEKQLKQIDSDIQKMYEAVEDNAVDERLNAVLQKIRAEERDVVQKSIDEDEINVRIEALLGKLQEQLTNLVTYVEDFKYEFADHHRSSKGNLFDALFKIDAGNMLLAEIEKLREQYGAECALMADVETAHKQITQGEISLHQLLEQLGIDPAKEELNIDEVDPERLKPLLKKIHELAAQLKEQKKKE